MGSEDIARVVGRDSELAELSSFLAGVAGGGAAGALVLVGEPGIGKTSLWVRAQAEARERGFRVLAARPSGAEVGLSHAALSDLLEGVDVGALSLAAPQRRALEVTLLRAEPEGDPPQPQAIALGFLNVLRALAVERPVLVAVDDLQWLDAASAETLAFAARRLQAEAAGLLLARRPGPATLVERALRGDAVGRVELGPLSLGALRELLVARLGLSPSRHLLRRIADATLGNPLFALEVGRVLVERGLPGITEELPVPDAVEDMLGARVTLLSPEARRPLLAVALGGDLPASELERLAGAEALAEAVEVGVLVVDDERVRASHPLLAAAAQKRSQPDERRALHRALARTAADEELRARHLARSTSGPDDEIAATVAAAAAAAAARGSRRAAVELGEHALDLTPPGSAQRSERVLVLAASLHAAAEDERLSDLLRREFPAIPAGPLRARAWMLLAEGADVRHIDQHREYLGHAVEEARNDAALRARVVAKASTAVIAVERIAEAEARTLEVLPDAERAGPDVERAVLFALAWARGLRGLPVDDLCDRFAAASASPGYLAESPERVAGQRLVWRGQVDEARQRFEALLELADERGEAGSFAWGQLHLCELELRVGDWPAAGRLLEEAERGPEGELFVSPVFGRCRALLEAGRGAPKEAERLATEAIAAAEAVGMQWDWLEALRARGQAALLAHEPARAAEALRTVWAHTTREGVDEPGVFPVAPELVEALVELGELDEARAVTERLRRLSAEQRHPWGLVSARRCEAVVRLAAAYDEEASGTLEQAAGEYGQLGLRFDQARTLLTGGRLHRRHRKWAVARRLLGDALAAFEKLGSPGWAALARSELERVGGRRAGAEGALTVAERRVAELAASGRSNKEIAQALFVTVNTVERQLGRVYAKLGVRSRSQLAGRL
jgi:DNA-binding CsgD family transcriptional regulator